MGIILKKIIADKIKKVPASGIRKFFEMVIGMPEVISLGVGEPDFVTPWHIREAAIYNLEKGYTMYTSNYGLIALRQEIAKYLKREYGVEYSPRREILITVGVSEALDLALRSIINPGDEVIIPEPCYVSYKPCTIFASGEPVILETKAKDGFEVNVEELERLITPKTKAIILGFPANPTGAVMKRTKLQEVAKVVEKYNLICISDEIYHQLTYEDKHTCFSSLPGMHKRTILLNGFSKGYAMTGWRIGFACGPKEIISAMTKIHQYTMLCAPIMSQMAALEALKNGANNLQEMWEEYNQRRRIILKELNKIGLTCLPPKGAFYVFPSIKNTKMTSEEFCQQLLKEEKVAVVPGNVFGRGGEGYIRISYAASLGNIKEALIRIERFVERYA